MGEPLGGAAKDIGWAGWEREGRFVGWGARCGGRCPPAVFPPLCLALPSSHFSLLPPLRPPCSTERVELLGVPLARRAGGGPRGAAHPRGDHRLGHGCAPLHKTSRDCDCRCCLLVAGSPCRSPQVLPPKQPQRVCREEGHPCHAPPAPPSPPAMPWPARSSLPRQGGAAHQRQRDRIRGVVWLPRQPGAQRGNCMARTAWHARTRIRRRCARTAGQPGPAGNAHPQAGRVVIIAACCVTCRPARCPSPRTRASPGSRVRCAALAGHPPCHPPTCTSGGAWHGAALSAASAGAGLPHPHSAALPVVS